MFVHCKSGVYTVTESDTIHMGYNSKNVFNSRYSKILHDPECHSQCCLNGFEQPTQLNTCSLENVLDIAMCNSIESSVIPKAVEKQFLYNTTTFSNFQAPEIQEDCDESVIDNIRTDFLQFSSDRQARTEQYTHFCNLSTETECKSESNCRGVLKRKRKRTVFTTEQIIAMEGVFKKRPYVGKEERLYLTKKLNVSENAIKIWFQNRRRVTERREKDRSDSCHSDSTVEEVPDVVTGRLDYIESYINKNTDNFGFVTLDDNIISELVSVINIVLSQHIDNRMNFFEIKNNLMQSDTYSMYEPISPESLPDVNQDTEDTLKWKPSIPEESLQRLIDIQSILL